MKRNKRVKVLLAVVTTALLLAIVIAGTATAGGPNYTRQRYSNDGRSNIPAYVPHQLIVRFIGDSVQTLSGYRAVPGSVTRLSGGPVYLLKLDSSINVLGAAAEMSQSPEVAYAQPNYVLNHSHPIQGSYPFPDENNKGSYIGQIAATQLGLPQVHKLADGMGVIVGVIDGGVDFSHPRLGGMAVSGHDFVDGDDDASDEPGGVASGHGTFVAGIIHLVAPTATIKSYRVMSAAGEGDGFTLSRAIEAAVADGCSIINMSLALTGENYAVKDAISAAAKKGVLVVAGAGNLGTNSLVYPAAEQDILAVGAVDSLSRKAGFSSFGSYVDLTAPGEDVYSTYLDSRYAWWSGTSFSAPFVSGLAALTKQRYPELNGAQIKNRLLVTASNIDNINPGFVGSLGAGLVNPIAALTAAITDDDTVGAAAWLTPWEMCFTATLTDTMIRCASFLTSSNAPATYLAEVHAGTQGFVTLIDTTGTTNDSVRFGVDPGRLSAAGFYTDTILYYVDGVQHPAMLVIHLTASGGSSGSVSCDMPGDLNDNHIAYELADVQILTSALAAGDPSVLGVKIGNAELTGDCRIDSADLATMWAIYEGNGIPVSECGNCAYYVLGSDTVINQGNGGVAWIDQPAVDMIAPYNSTTTLYKTLMLSSTVPGTYTAQDMLNSANWLVYQPAGVTNASVVVGANPTGLQPGTYVDTLVFIASGVSNPVYLSVALTVSDPDTVQCDMPGDLNGNHLPYEVADLAILDTALAVSNIRVLGSRIGNAELTGDCRIDSADLALMAGIVQGTEIPVSECGSCAYYVFQHDSIGGPGSDEAWTVPTSLTFSAPSGSTSTMYENVVLLSVYQTSYAATHRAGTNWLIFGPSGNTNDSALVGANPTGLQAGQYVDTLVFAVNGVSKLVVVPVTLYVTGADSTRSDMGGELTLSNYPNPFNPSTECVYSLPTASHVKLTVYDIMGREVAVLVNESQPAGRHSATWRGTSASGSPAASGVYLYRIEANGVSLTRKMLLLK